MIIVLLNLNFSNFLMAHNAHDHPLFLLAVPYGGLLNPSPVIGRPSTISNWLANSNATRISAGCIWKAVNHCIYREVLSAIVKPFHQCAPFFLNRLERSSHSNAHSVDPEVHFFPPMMFATTCLQLYRLQKSGRMLVTHLEHFSVSRD